MGKISRRGFLRRVAAVATVAALEVLVPSTRVIFDMGPVIQRLRSPAGRYLLEDNFEGYGSVDGTLATPGPGVRTVADWDAGVDVRGAGLTIADGAISWPASSKFVVVQKPGRTIYWFQVKSGDGWQILWTDTLDSLYPVWHPSQEPLPPFAPLRPIDHPLDGFA